MRRIVTAFAATVTAVVLLLSYHTSTNSAVVPGTVAVGAAAGSPPGGPGSVPLSGGSTGSSTGSATAARTVTGDVVGTRWGPVQVAITVSGGRITRSQAVQVPTGNPRDDEINQVAVPLLDAAVLQAQSARIDTVSGATVTSDGYVSSLQSAIDRAAR